MRGGDRAAGVRRNRMTTRAKIEIDDMKFDDDEDKKTDQLLGRIPEEPAETQDLGITDDPF